MRDWHTLYYDENYVKARNKLTPKAEEIADDLHGKICTSIRQKERDAWTLAWNREYHAAMDRMWREKA